MITITILLKTSKASIKYTRLLAYIKDFSICSVINDFLAVFFKERALTYCYLTNIAQIGVFIRRTSKNFNGRYGCGSEELFED